MIVQDNNQLLRGLRCVRIVVAVLLQRGFHQSQLSTSADGITSATCSSLPQSTNRNTITIFRTTYIVVQNPTSLPNRKKRQHRPTTIWVQVPPARPLHGVPFPAKTREGVINSQHQTITWRPVPTPQQFVSEYCIAFPPPTT